MATISIEDFIGMLKGKSNYSPQVTKEITGALYDADLFDFENDDKINTFITPCCFESGKRTKMSFKTANVLYAEIDDYKGNVANLFVLKPTLLLRTSILDNVGSYQMYWALEEPIHTLGEMQDALNVIKDIFGNIIDTGAILVSQLFRVPDSLRYKKKNRAGHPDKSQVTAMFYNTGLTYRVEDFEVWRSLGANTKKSIVTRTKVGKRSEVDFGVMSELVRHGASERLIKSIFHYSNVGEKFREKGEDYFNRTYTKVAESTNVLGAIPHDVVERNGCLLIEGKTKTTTLLNTVPRVVRRLFPYKDDALPVLIHLDVNGKDVYLSTVDMQSKAKLAQKFAHTGAELFAQNSYIHQLHLYFIDEAFDKPVMDYTSTVGIVEYKNVYYRVPSGACPLIYIAKKDIKYTLNSGDDNVKEQLEAFLALNDRKVTQAVAGWFTLVLFKSFLEGEDMYSRIPIFMLGGATGSGKTTVIDEAYKLFGVSKETIAGKKTEFSLIKLLSESKTIPIFIKEFRANDQDSTNLSTMLRNAFDEEATAQRGTSGVDGLGTVDFELFRPTIIDGQDRFLEIAMVTRSLNYKLLHKHNKNTLDRWLELDTSTFSYHLLNHVLHEMNNNRLELIKFFNEAMEEVKVAYKDLSLQDRPKKNLGLLWFGIKFLYSFVGIDTPNILDLLDAYEIIYNKEKDYLRGDATYLIEYLLSTKAVDQTTMSFEATPEDNFIKFGVSKLVRSYNQYIIKSGLSTTNVLSKDAYLDELNAHGLFVKSLGNGRFEVDKKKAFEYGLRV